MSRKEASARLKINRMIEQSSWRLLDTELDNYQELVSADKNSSKPSSGKSKTRLL